MISRCHAPEVLVAGLALLCVIVFIVLHVIMGNGSEIWWLLAISTMLLAISDLIMRSKR